MFKRSVASICLIVCVFFVFGCASMFPVGSIYSDVKIPMDAGGGGDASYTKIGTSEAVSVLSLVAVGDASIEKACKNGGITKIKYVDWSANNVLGILGTYKTKVYGD